MAGRGRGWLYQNMISLRKQQQAGLENAPGLGINLQGVVNQSSSNVNYNSNGSDALQDRLGVNRYQEDAFADAVPVMNSTLNDFSDETSSLTSSLENFPDPLPSRDFIVDIDAVSITSSEGESPLGDIISNGFSSAVNVEESTPPQEVPIIVQNRVDSSSENNVIEETPVLAEELNGFSEDTSSENVTSTTSEETFPNESSSSKELLNCLKHFNPLDDGIQFNQKLRYFIECCEDSCLNAEDFMLQFRSLYQTCCYKTDLIPKLIMVVTARSLRRKDICGVSVNAEFLKHLQADFQCCEELRIVNKPLFRNVLLMLAEFYHKNMKNNMPLAVLEPELMKSLEMLLETADPLDLKLFTKLLYLNGQYLKVTPASRIMLTVRKLLMMKRNLPPESVVRLLLSLDLVSRRNLLNGDVLGFYRDQLGDDAIADLEGITISPSSETEDVKFLPKVGKNNMDSVVGQLRLAFKGNQSC